MKLRPRGFTLLEILVALSIFAILSMVAYSGLNQMAAAKVQVDGETRRWRDLTLILGRLDEDVSMTVNRPWRDRGGLSQPAMRGAATLAAEFDCQLELVRKVGGSGALHLGYRLKGGQLQLLLWDVLDQAPRTEPQVHVLLDNVRDFSVQFLDINGDPSPTWPIKGQEGKLPRGVLVKLTPAQGGPIQRLYALP